MASRGAVIALSLSIAALLIAMAAQGASAEQTAFECIKTSNATSKFKDPHYVEEGAPAGGFGPLLEKLLGCRTRNQLHHAHRLRGPGKQGRAPDESGRIREIRIHELRGSEAGQHKCKVREPIVVEAEGESVDGVGFMAVRFTGIAAAPLGEIEFQNKSAVEICPAAIKGAKLLTGSAEGTANALPEGRGATTVVTPAMSSLKLGTSAATLSATGTVTRGSTVNALALTTPPYTE